MKEAQITDDPPVEVLEARSPPGDLRAALLTGVGVFLLFVAFLPPDIYSVDGLSMLAVAKSLVIHRNVTVPSTPYVFTVPPGMEPTSSLLGLPGHDGKYYSVWYPLLSVLAVPFVSLGMALADLTHTPPEPLITFCSLLLPALLTAATTSLVVLLARRCGSSRKGAFLAAISFAFGTIAVVYARAFFAEPLLAFLTIAGVFVVLDGKPRGSAVAGIIGGLAVLAKPAGIVVGPVLSASLLLKHHPLRFAWMPAGGAVVGFLAYLLYNVMRFGTPLAFGQTWEFALPAMLDGLAGLVFSPGRGLVWYCPPAALVLFRLPALLRSHTPAVLPVTGLFLGYLLLHAFWLYWGGGWCWGPRLIFPVVPPLVALAGLMEGPWRKALMLATAVGVLIHLPTLVSTYERYYHEANAQRIPWREILWVPEYAPLVRVWGSACRQFQDALAGDIGSVAVVWWRLPFAGVPWWVGWGVMGCLLGGGIWLLWRVSRQWQDG